MLSVICCFETCMDLMDSANRITSLGNNGDLFRYKILGLDDEVNMEHDAVYGTLKLKDSALNGMATSKPYMPTLPFKGCHAISYKATDN